MGHFIDSFGHNHYHEVWDSPNCQRFFTFRQSSRQVVSPIRISPIFKQNVCHKNWHRLILQTLIFRITNRTNRRNKKLCCCLFLVPGKLIMPCMRLHLRHPWWGLLEGWIRTLSEDFLAYYSNHIRKKGEGVGGCVWNRNPLNLSGSQGGLSKPWLMPSPVTETCNKYYSCNHDYFHSSQALIFPYSFAARARFLFRDVLTGRPSVCATWDSQKRGESQNMFSIYIFEARLPAWKWWRLGSNWLIMWISWYLLACERGASGSSRKKRHLIRHEDCSSVYDAAAQ